MPLRSLRCLSVVVVALAVFFGQGCAAASADAPDPNSSNKVVHEHVEGEDAAQHKSIGHDLPYWTVAPFALLLLCIAVLPLATPHH